MLENLRKQGASAFIWVVFAILIGMFVINFGPSSAGASGGCHLGGGKKTTLKVGGADIDETGLRLAINLGQYLERGQGSDSQTRRAMERLIRRELLAGEAERRGLRVPEGLVDDAITHGQVHYAGQVVNAQGLFFARLKDDTTDADDEAPVDPSDMYFDYKRFKAILRNMGISVGAYKHEQTREILASTMARIFIHQVPASREEALAQYITDNTRVSFNDVRFDAARYADALIIGDTDIDRFIKGHQAEVKAAYDPAAWKGKKQVHLRRIFVAKAPPPPAPTPPPTPDGATPPTPPAAPADPGKAKLETLRGLIASGKRGFAEVAQATDANAQFAARSGDWGWYDEGLFTLSEPALNDAAKALVPGKVSDVIEGSDGFYLLLVDDHREGDLTIDQVQRELALPMAKAAWGKEAARRAAIAAVKEATESGKHLGELFPMPTKTGMAPGPITIIEDRPVAWGQAGEGSTAAPTPTAPTPTAPTPAAPAPAVGSAAPTPAVGSAPAAPAGPPPIMVPSNETLPALGPIERPTVERHDGVVRAGDVTPLGASAELANALFEQLSVGGVADRIFEVRSSVVDPMPQYALIQMTAKDLADVAEFDKQAEQLLERLALTRGYQLYTEWLRNRCTTLANAGKIKPDWAYLQTYDEQNRKQPITYQPCESLIQP